MDRQDIMTRLREIEAELRARGVAHAALFGSQARGESNADRDTDIMIEIDPDAPVGVYASRAMRDYLETHDK
jgi:predicted nucleotidyltransferase